jgi:hypothetical protein
VRVPWTREQGGRTCTERRYCKPAAPSATSTGQMTGDDPVTGFYVMSYTCFDPSERRLRLRQASRAQIGFAVREVAAVSVSATAARELVAAESVRTRRSETRERRLSVRERETMPVKSEEGLAHSRLDIARWWSHGEKRWAERLTPPRRRRTTSTTTITTTTTTTTSLRPAGWWVRIPAHRLMRRRHAVPTLRAGVPPRLLRRLPLLLRRRRHHHLWRALRHEVQAERAQEAVRHRPGRVQAGLRGWGGCVLELHVVARCVTRSRGVRALVVVLARASGGADFLRAAGRRRRRRPPRSRGCRSLQGKGPYNSKGISVGFQKGPFNSI